jgi:hypothetical protein
LFTLFVVPAMYVFLGTDHARRRGAQAPGAAAGAVSTAAGVAE